MDTMGNTNVLIVDDDPIVRFIHDRIIGSLAVNNIQCFQAPNGMEAIKIMNEHLIDVILLDLNMPIMSGFQFLKQVNESKLIDKDKTRIIVVSSSENPHDTQQCIDFGVSRIPKPISKIDIEMIIDKARLLPKT
jgi:CheY-like chemotaxis protein